MRSASAKTFRGITGHKLATGKRVIDKVTCSRDGNEGERERERERERGRQRRRRREREREQYRGGESEGRTEGKKRDMREISKGRKHAVPCELI